ncbi:MbtH family protein [Actinoplanes derwentensis]|uniref:MbtH protein n=1 Tax=Actinoplanes derwentensis TaxID=113562 RepID=A0A1H2CIN3_9ACTN|nr:MbtH family protein [Actinoplanes derwentensis]GID89599.1 MbtH protein [Actinoplanes derwentensis]SDT70107.1 MbtH protein [Actinoplanes derwentensis]
MTSILDNAEGTFVVLTNSEGGHSLWPGISAVPAGWTVRFGPAGRPECLDHVEKSWVALSPDGFAKVTQHS